MPTIFVNVCEVLAFVIDDLTLAVHVVGVRRDNKDHLGKQHIIELGQMDYSLQDY